MTTYPRHGRLMTISAAAEYADVHPVTLRRWVAAGRLPAYRVGPRLLKIDLDDLESIIRPIRSQAADLQNHSPRSPHDGGIKSAPDRRFRRSGAVLCWWAILGLNQ